VTKYDLTWGEAVAIRKAFLGVNFGESVNFGREELMAMDYTPFSGDEKLIEETAKIIKRQTGMTYDHIFLTNGAAGGCTIAMRAYAKTGTVGVITNPPPYFSIYPTMISAAGLRHVTTQRSYNGSKPHVTLLDSPSNPTGQITDPPHWAMAEDVIWDSVYHTAAYCSLILPAPEHDVVVGSYSKLTGLNGLRLGWIATDNDYLAGIIEKLVAAEYCGLSRPSKVILKYILDLYNEDPDRNWGMFEQCARKYLNNNRTEWSKLEKFFHGTAVPANGMFYYAHMDAACKRLMEKAGVGYQLGSKCGTDDGFGRFNIGQDCDLVREAVKSVLKADKI
jgi:aspartate/methionine/tyrosine aminotransferase